MDEKYYIEDDDPFLKSLAKEAAGSELLSRFHQKHAKYLQNAREIIPGQIVITLAPNKKKQRTVYTMLWGFNLNDPLRVAHSVPIENIEKDERYKEDYLKHRCILPASFFIERKHKRSNDGSVTMGHEFAVQPYGASRTYLCGIYRIESEGLPHCVLLSSPAPEGEYRQEMSDRIPVIVSGALADEWLNPDANPKEILKHRLTDFVYEEYTPSYDTTKFWTF